MTSRSKSARWETRPLECWNKAKELRRDFERARVEAAANNKLLVEGTDASMFEALGGLQGTPTNPVGAIIQAQAIEFARECRAAMECQGYGREICGYHRSVYGGMYLNRDRLGGPFPRRDFCIPDPHLCDQHGLMRKPSTDFFGIPRFQGNYPVYLGSRDPERTKFMREHRVAELLDEIEWLEKITGRKFNDEVYRDMVRSQLRLRALRGEVSAMNQNVPAPVDQKSVYSIFTLGGLTKTDQGPTEQFWHELRDEVQWRVDHHIAGVATERYRWLEDEPPPWHFLKYYRYMENYGAVCVGSPYSLGAWGWVWRKDGTFGPPEKDPDVELPLNTREEIVRANLNFPAEAHENREIEPADKPGKVRLLLDMAKAFKVDGAIRPYWRAGVGCDYDSREAALGLVEAGINVMTYESSQPGDRTDIDEGRLLDQLDTWMASQGLSKLDD